MDKNSNFAEDMNKDEIIQKDMNNSPLKYKGEFEAVYSIIAAHRERVVRVVNNESMAMVWKVGGYVSNKLKSYKDIVPFETAQM